MAQASESQASGPLAGELEALFGSDAPPKPIYRDDAIRNLERELTSDVNIARGGLNNVLRKFRRQQGLNAPLLRSATLESDSALRNILQRQTSPYDELTRLGDYVFNKTQAVPSSVLNYLSNAQNISNLARGINPGAASSYDTLLRGGIATRAGLDANRAALSSLSSLFPQLQGAIQARDQTLMSILPLRRAGFEALEARALNPYQAQLAALGDLQRLGMGQNALNMGNLQGYQPRQNWANRVGAAGRATTANINQLFDWAQQAASIYGSLMGGGGMGGTGGGGSGGSLTQLFGGGGSQNMRQPHWSDSYFMKNFGRGDNYPSTAADYAAAGRGTYGMPYGTMYNPSTNTSDFAWGQ